MLRGMVSVAVQATVVTPSFTSTPTPGLSGYTTYIVNLTSDSGDIDGIGIDIQGLMLQGAPPYGVFLPDTLPNPFIDSCFLFRASEILGFGSESATSLTCAISFSGGGIAAASLDIAQVTMANGNTATMTGAVMIGIDEVPFADITIPEPASAALLAIGSLGLMLERFK